MSLRELPPGQGVSYRPTLATRLRYVPLSLLAIAGMVLGVGGYFVQRSLAAAPPPPPDLSDAAPVEPGDLADAFPAECRTPVEPPAQELWLEGDATSAEAVFQSHLSELGNDYVVGTDGYVFWSDRFDSNFSQAIGRRVLSETEATAWADYITSVQTKLTEMGIPFYVLVGPGKWAVYPQNLPEWAQSVRGSSAMDQLLAGHPDLPIIDVRGDLREASLENSVYSRVNSHWTDYGAQVAWNGALRCMNAVSPELGPLAAPTIGSVTIGPDFSEFAVYGVTNPVPDWTIPVYSEPMLPVAVTKSDGLTQLVDGTTRATLVDVPLSTATAGAQVDKSLLLVRDSMGDSLSIPAQQTFAQTWQIPHYLNTPDSTTDIVALATQLRPSVVVLEFAQRYFNLPPPAVVG